MKKSFIIYDNWALMISQMPNEEAGQLIKKICKYKISGECDNGFTSVDAVFSMIKVTLDEDARKYEETCEKRREAIKSRWDSKENRKDTNEIQMNTNVLHENTDTDTDTDNDNVNDNDNNIIIATPEKEIFITLTLNDKSEYSVSVDDVKKYKELYPAVDVEQQLRNMKGWCDSNPTKRKTKSGIKRFINGWLSREQDNNRSYDNKMTDRQKDSQEKGYQNGSNADFLKMLEAESRR